eukprot:15132303-Heterocapsa_arctica.AAC.1
MTDNKTDTEWVGEITGVGTWRICRNPICHRCDIIDKAEMEAMTPKERTNHHVHWHAEDRIELGRPYCEAADWGNCAISDEQQDRDNDATEIRCDQTDDRGSEGGHYSTVAVR